MSLRALLRALPCRPSAMPELRGPLVEALGDGGTSGGRKALLSEATFLLQAQQHLEELNQRYFPLSGKTQQEVVAATAARVGLRMPKAADGPTSQ